MRIHNARYFRQRLLKQQDKLRKQLPNKFSFEKRQKARTIYVYSHSGELIGEYNGLAHAADELGLVSKHSKIKYAIDKEKLVEGYYFSRSGIFSMRGENIFLNVKIMAKLPQRRIDAYHRFLSKCFLEIIRETYVVDAERWKKQDLINAFTNIHNIANTVKDLPKFLNATESKKFDEAQFLEKIKKMTDIGLLKSAREEIGA